MNRVLHNEPVAVLLEWQHALPNKCSKEVWIMAFYAIIWSIWLLRNNMVFNGKVFDFKQTIDTIKFCIASWFKAKWPDCSNTLMDVVRFPNAIEIPRVAKNAKKAILWASPPLDSLKFNVDGLARGTSEPVGIGGVLRDGKATVKAIFSRPLEWQILTLLDC